MKSALFIGNRSAKSPDWENYTETLLSASLNISVTYRHGALTEEGYLFTYDSPCTDEHALRKAVTNFGKTFHNYYELQITEDGFTVLQHTRNQNRREEPPA